LHTKVTTEAGNHTGVGLWENVLLGRAVMKGSQWLGKGRDSPAEF
jgi:hypothetical protein